MVDKKREKKLNGLLPQKNGSEKKEPKSEKQVKQTKPVKIKIMPILLSLLVIVVIGFVIYGLQYYFDLTKSNDTNSQGQDGYGNQIDLNNSISVDYNDTVKVHYELTVDGEKKDSSYDRNVPFTFTVGKGVVKGFSDGVVGMRVGEERTIVVSPEDGYGTNASTKIEDMNYSLTSLMMYYYQQTGETKTADELINLKLYTQAGGECTFKSYIAEKDLAKLVCVVPPHPLAGKTLTFRIKMLEISKATE